MGLTVEKQSINGYKNRWMVLLLITVHVVTYLLGKMLIGTKRYSTNSEKAEFPRKFRILFVLLTIINACTAFICLPLVMGKGNHKDGDYYNLWILSDIMLLIFI